MRLKCVVYESTLSTAVAVPLPQWGRLRYENTAPPHCHFERKREIFFVRGQAKDVRIAASWKHRASSESEGRCFMQTALRKKTETGNEKDPSAALGMTKRGNASFHSFSTCCGSQPRLAALGSPFQGKEGECRLTDFPRRRLTIRECRFPHIVISSESEKSFSFAVRQRM